MNTSKRRRNSKSPLTPTTPLVNRRPTLQFNANGQFVNDNVENRTTTLPQSKVSCAGARSKNGLRNTGFMQCFRTHLATLSNPSFARAAASMGNQSKMNALCSQSTLSPHQLVVYELAKVMSSTPTENMGEHRGLLVYHSTGTGKTLSSLAIIMAFWPTDKKIVVVSSKSNTAQAIDSYKREAPKFFPTEFKLIVDEYRKRKGGGHLSDAEAFGAALTHRIQGLTFVEARNRLAANAGEFKTIKAIPLHAGGGSVMIIDEAQGLSMKTRADPKGDAIKLGCALRKLSQEKMRKIRIFAMTATPGNNIKQWLKLLSVVRRADQLPFTLDSDTGGLCGPATPSTRNNGRDDAPVIQNILRSAKLPGPAPPQLTKYVQDNLGGLVAYVDIRNDMSRYACIKEVTMNVQLDRYYFLAMLKFNTQDRLKADRGPAEVAQHRFDPRAPDSFMKRMRTLGNSLPKTVWGSLPKEVQDTFVRNRRILKVNENTPGRLVSPKFIMLADYLGTKPGKQYCYTVSGNESILALAMTKWYGITNVTRRAEAFDGAHVNKSTGKIVGIPVGKHMVVMNDTTTKEHRQRLVNIFNSPANATGAYIKLMIVSGQLYEGLDLTGLRHVHIAEPMVTPLHEAQAIGRGARNCSHRGLPIVDRNVTLVRWSSVAPAGGWPALMKIIATMKGLRGKVTAETLQEEYQRLNGMSYDQLVFQRARNDPDFVILQNFERVIKAFAIDCSILSSYHPGIACGRPMLTNEIEMSAGTSCPK